MVRRVGLVLPLSAVTSPCWPAVAATIHAAAAKRAHPRSSEVKYAPPARGRDGASGVFTVAFFGSGIRAMRSVDQRAPSAS